MTLFPKITVDSIRKSLPTYKSQRIEKRPTYATLKPILKVIRKCAESIPSTQVKGHLYLLVDDAKFLAITSKTKTVPVKSPLNPILNLKDTQFVIQELRSAHNRLEEEFQIDQSVQRALKQIIAETIDEMFLTDINIKEKSVLQVIEYLRARYYRITTAEILHND